MPKPPHLAPIKCREAEALFWAPSGLFSSSSYHREYFQPPCRKTTHILALWSHFISALHPQKHTKLHFSQLWPWHIIFLKHLLLNTLADTVMSSFQVQSTGLASSHAPYGPVFRNLHFFQEREVFQVKRFSTFTSRRVSAAFLDIGADFILHVEVYYVFLCHYLKSQNQIVYS